MDQLEETVNEEITKEREIMRQQVKQILGNTPMVRLMTLKKQYSDVSEELEAKRKEYEERKKEMKKRQKLCSEKKLHLLQQLYRYHRVIQDNEAKKKKALEEIEKHKKALEGSKNDICKLKELKKNLEESLKVLRRQVESKLGPLSYLGTVVSSSNFKSNREILNKWEDLMITRKGMLEASEDRNRTVEETQCLYKASIEAIKDKIQRQQAQLDALRSTTLDSVENVKMEKSKLNRNLQQQHRRQQLIAALQLCVQSLIDRVKSAKNYKDEEEDGRTDGGSSDDVNAHFKMVEDYILDLKDFVSENETNF